MGYKYDTQVIYGSTKVTRDSFHLEGVYYYTTKTGKHKKKEAGEKTEMIIWAEYEHAWNKYKEIFL